MTNLIADLLSLVVILYMMIILAVAVVGVPAALAAIVGRVVGIW